MRVIPVAVALAVLAGCSAGRPAPQASPSPTAPVWNRAPRVGDVCARLDVASIAAILGRTDLKGVPVNTILGSLGHDGDHCRFQLPQKGLLDIGINPIPMTAAIPGPEQAMRTLLDAYDLPSYQRIPGVGDLALYDPLDPPGKAGTFSFWAVQGKDVRWYGITIWGYDPTPEHSMLGAIGKDHLVGIAKRCLDGL